MFSKARWRLTFWFAGALAAIVVIIGGAVFLTARKVLFDQVNHDLVARAERERQPLAQRLIERARDGQPIANVNIGPAFTAGGYFYAVIASDGELIGSTSNTDPEGLPAASAAEEAVSNGSRFVDTVSSEGEHLRVYLLPVTGPREKGFVMEVGRSTEPERQALRRLLVVLVGGGGVGLLLALGGGLLLAGWALRPISSAMDRQHAFVADASHELRTPLAIIRANAEILKRAAEKPVAENISSVDDVIAETDRLSGMVGQLLTLARADAGEVASGHSAVNLSELVEQVASQMRLLAEPKHTRIEVQTNSPVMVPGDPARLRELLTILVDNAVKYSDDRASVCVNVRRDGAKAMLRVSDNGRGIAVEALPRVFDRFYRADKARSRRDLPAGRQVGGSGLGLSIAKAIVDGHGGTIGIASVVGEGTVVTVELPAG